MNYYSVAQAQAEANKRNKYVERRTAHLNSLRSVSAAFKATVKEEPLYVPRQGTQEVTRHPTQASNTGGDGGLEADINTTGGRYRVYADGRVQHSNGVYLASATAASFIQQYAHLIGRTASGTGRSQLATTPTPALAPKPQPKIIQAGEIIAWRAWSPSSTRLRSVSAGNVWEPHTPMTENHPGHDIRVGGGVHAFRTRKEAEKHFSPRTYVIGEVELWGEVVEHEDGYRAQFGAVRSLASAPSADQLNSLRRIYGVTPPTQSWPLATTDSSGAPVLLGTIAATILLAFVFLTNAFVKGPPTATSYYNGNYTTK